MITKVQMMIDLDAIPPITDRTPKVYLSRRNLLTLLSKLDPPPVRRLPAL